MNASVRDPRQIEAEADRTREAMAETLDALQHKLSPGELVDRGLRYVRENGGEFAGHFADDVKSNPLPTLLVGVGLAWMMASGRRPAAGPADRSDTRPIARGTGAQPHRAGRAESMKDTAQSAAGSVRDKAHSISELTTERYAEARAGVSHMLEEQPLMLGGLAFALGAAAGAAAPRTRKEEEALHKLRGDRDDAEPLPKRDPAIGDARVERESTIDPGASRADRLFEEERSRDWT
ncbi:MAG: DUF3618 domain-containing protein [Gammaproteobacteria bacterium]